MTKEVFEPIRDGLQEALASAPNPLPTTEGVTQTPGPGWTLDLCIGECRDQAKDQAFQEAGFAEFMRATADHLERLRAIDKAEGVTQGWQDILSRSFMYSDMGFDDRGNRSFKMIIKTQTLKDLQDLQAALVGALPPPPGQ
jgi:hypothetical protein